MEAKVYTQDGKESGKVKLPEDVFNLPWNSDLVHQVVVSMESNARVTVAHTKDRSEVSGGGKKPWKQKGTGRARHGSIRSPLWIGGGVTHGPRNEKNFKKKINKKMKIKALYVVLSEKLRNNEILFLNDIKLEKTKTKIANQILFAISKISGFSKLSENRKSIMYLIMPKRNKIIEKSFNNLLQVVLGETRNINPVELLKHKYLVITNPKESIELITKKTI